jgi:hypothetical protein
MLCLKSFAMAEFTLTVAERHLYLSLGEETLTGIIERVEIGGTAGS